ncbi:unnamed protein product [Parnassius mnemosyne]|uniref:Uncharacterized protein n=1 Tax=Parnassius mnemosyne TaxID=213953 RepID=A0AAV1LG23_9NEOP
MALLAVKYFSHIEKLLGFFCCFDDYLYLNIPNKIQSSGRKIVLSGRKFSEQEKVNKGPIIPFENVRLRVAAMIGISKKTVSTITKQGEVTTSTSTKISTIEQWSKQNKIELDDFDLCAVKNKIHQIYIVRKHVPTLGKFTTLMGVASHYGK